MNSIHYPFINDDTCSIEQGSISDIAVPSDPATVCRTPKIKKDKKVTDIEPQQTHESWATSDWSISYEKNDKLTTMNTSIRQTVCSQMHIWMLLLYTPYILQLYGEHPSET